MYATNVDGTFNVIDAAGHAGCQRIIYTSTVGCIGLPKEVNGEIMPSTEADTIAAADITNDYKRSKWQAELIAAKFAREGLPVIIVNPSAPIGPGDLKPTPTGQIIVDFLNRELPAYLETGLNWVHVRDVAVGHILAAEKGQLGQRYILGNKTGNWTMENTLAVLEEISGVPAPKMKIPHWVAIAAAHVDEGTSFFTRKTAQGAAGRRAHGQTENVVQSGKSHPRTRPAPDAAQRGLRRSRRMVLQERLCEMIKAEL